MLAASSNFTAVLMFLAGCGLLTMLLLRRSYRYFNKCRGRRSSSQPIDLQRRPASQWDGAYPDASARIERQKVELHEFAREADGRLNSKLIMLEQLIDRSDRQIARLESLLGQLESVRPNGATRAPAAIDGPDASCSSLS